MGLSDVYVVVRGTILMTHLMPKIGQALSMVLQEERQRELHTFAHLISDSSAFLSQHRQKHLPPKQYSQPSYYNSTSSTRKTPLFCNYCRRNGHAIDRCFKLQRQRENSISTEKGKRLVATAQHDEAPPSDPVQHNIPSFTHDQYTKLHALLNRHDLETSVSPGESLNAAMLAGKVFCFSVSNPRLKWIIDSGATDHITPNLQYFSSYSPFSQESFIVMPNGKHAKVHHIGTIQLTPSLTLSNALHVPEFHYNLLSASKLAKQVS